MFTGIINHLGTITDNSNTHLTIQVPVDLYKQLNHGMSIAVNGTCLTVVKQIDPDQFRIEFMPETAKKTTMGTLKKNDVVNLELPVTTATLFAGHIVQGHVDDVATISSIKNEGNSRLIIFNISPSISKYIVEKGSITVNGISLTVIDVTHDSFSVGIIPHTWTHTMLHTTQAGSKVNIEVDVLAKYVEKLQQSS